MKNSRYLDKAIERYLDKGRRVNGLDAKQIKSLCGEIQRYCDEIADESSEAVQLDLPDEFIMRAMKAAHERGVTFNEYMNLIILAEIERVDNG